MAGAVGAGEGPLAPLTSFVGRDQQIQQIRAALGRDRLVSLLGVGGIGKSRLAAAVVEQYAGQPVEQHAGPPAEVATVLFTPTLEPTDVTQAVHDAVNQGNQQVSLADAVADRALLLVLDGCEHQRDRIRELLTGLLPRCPRLRVLATSRVPLRVDGECLIHVPPLASTRADGEELSPAARLFEDRARAVIGPLGPEDRDGVEELCRRLDGLPLAIELAASRTRTMTVWEMLDGIGDWATMLRPHPSAAEHRSLEAVLRWSWDHCGPAERRVWAQLSVFAGPITLAAAKAVCDLPEDVVADVIDDLVAGSLLLRRTRHKITTFRMLDTIAAFGRESLEDGGENGDAAGALTLAELRARHARYYARLGRSLNTEWLGPDQARLSQRTGINIADFRAAFDHLLRSPGDHAPAVDLYADLWPYWISCGRLREGRAWLRRLTDRRAPLHARALCIAGWTELVLGNTRDAVRHLSASVDATGSTAGGSAGGDLRSELLSRTLRSACHAISGHGDGSAGEYRDGIARFEVMGDDLTAALLWEIYAELAVISGDLAEGRSACTRAQRICRAHGEQWILSWALWVEALADYLAGDLDAAIRNAGEAWSLKVALDDLLGAAVVVEVAGWAHAGRGEERTAATLLGATTHYWSGTDWPLLGLTELLRHRDRCLAAIRRTLDDAERERAERTGMRVGLLALRDHVHTAPATPAPEPDRPASARTAALTPREREIAGYVRAGLTNKEIAERLTVSARTVESHVSQILTKTGVARRSGIAAALLVSPNPGSDR